MKTCPRCEYAVISTNEKGQILVATGYTTHESVLRHLADRLRESTRYIQFAITVADHVTDDWVMVTNYQWSPKTARAMLEKALGGYGVDPREWL